MSTITTLRPSATSSGVGWSAQPTGTLNGVTSDDSDSTYALWSGSGSALILATPVDSPPVGERRHQARVRARGEDGDAWWSVRLSTGGLIAGAAGQFPASPTTVTGAWGTGLPPDGATILSTYLTAESDGVKINELYLDVDTRLAPSFTIQTLDGSGAVTTTIADTNQPTIHADAVALDGLSARQYRFWVTSGATIVWDSGIVSGAPSDQQVTTALNNGTYTAHGQIWTTLGANTAYASDEETLNFTVAVGEIPAPDNPTVDPVDGTPLYDVTACAPNTTIFDGGVGYVEIQRVDCQGELTSIAILGPLTTGQCASWRDFTLPRANTEATCDHAPDPCCSYYRTRTVGRIDDQIRISAWSDSLDPGLPQGLTFMWPGTAGTIPAGWNRVTALDGRYVKSVPDNFTDPGVTGGAATHTHTAPGHTHDVTHAHTVTGNTGAATGTANITSSTGTAAAAATHTHTRPAPASATVVSGSTSSAVDAIANDPARLEVIFMESDGTPLGVPDSALALTGDDTITGWSAYSIGSSRFLKGAAAAGNGGTQAASTLEGHSHPLGTHTHSGTAHTHTSANTGAFASANSFTSGATAVLNVTSHTHPITVGSASTAGLTSAGNGNSGTATGTDPSYRDVKAQRNTSGSPSIPVGIMALWTDELTKIPNHWQLCDGTGGTLDMRGRYPRCVTGSTGGTGGSLATHAHTSLGHNHPTSGHSHTESIGSAGAATSNATGTAVAVSTGTHTHSASDTNSTTPTVASTTPGNLSGESEEPAHTQVAFIKLTSAWAPPVDPTLFCLDWDDDYHLIRTLGPDGEPLWAPIGGTFDWDKDRPFTSATGVNGTAFVTSAPPGERNLKMTAAVESEAALQALLAILARPLVLISPSDSREVWAAPVAASVNIIRIGRIRQVTADFTGTGPQPEPQLADVGS